MPEQQELHRLQEENRKLTLEREISKKAAAFFANEDYITMFYNSRGLHSTLGYMSPQKI
ncbi:MAG: hypothetical protein OXC05_01740 [Halieaceae bacterium]|nr:hypothetical protein [Halieaceae bacterium]